MGQIFTLIPWLVGILSLSIAVNALIEFANPKKSGGFSVEGGFSLGQISKAFTKSFSPGAYKYMKALYITLNSMIGIFTILGFVAFGFSFINN